MQCKGGRNTYDENCYSEDLLSFFEDAFFFLACALAFASDSFFAFAMATCSAFFLASAVAFL
jgi:hypothetical protein